VQQLFVDTDGGLAAAGRRQSPFRFGFNLDPTL